MSAAATSNLRGVSLSACDTNLGHLIHVFIDEVRNKDTSYYKFTSLKRLELCGSSERTNLSSNGYTGYLTEELEELVRFLKQQDGLETLIIEGFMNIVEKDNTEKGLPIFGGFEGFYNYLPHVISKSSFKLL